MTLFVHTLPIPQVVQLWTYLFTQKVEFIFFITVAILRQLKPTLLMLDLNQTLLLINKISGLISIPETISIALQMMSECPESFIVTDLVLDIESHLKDIEPLASNEYFA